MKKIKKISVSIILFLTVELACSGNSLYQASTVQALIKGLYQKTQTVGQVKQFADTGLGCGVGIGELIAVDGFFFVADGHGYITKLKDTDGIPFFSGSKFVSEIKYSVRDIVSLEELEKTIAQHIKSDNIFYVIKVDGYFKQVYARSEDRITKPVDYKPLLEWMKDHQNKFYFKELNGTLIVVKAPEIVKNIGVPGYHVHFINNARTVGGHVFDVQIEKADVEIQPLYSMNLILPETKEFLSADMTTKAKEKDGFKHLETK